MRFYLLYKDHGLYDPVLDDTEYIYVPIDPQYIERDNADGTIQNVGTNSIGSTAKNSTTPEPLHIPDIDEKNKLKANFHDALLELSAGDLPETARYKLPISEDYDPDGKKVTKLQKLYAKQIMAVDLKSLMEKMNEQCQNVQNLHEHSKTEEVKSQDLNEMTKNEVEYSQKMSGGDLETLKNTASRIVSDSIEKAVSLATEMKQKDALNSLPHTVKSNMQKETSLESTLHVKSLKQISENVINEQKDYATMQTEIEANIRHEKLSNELDHERLNVAEEIQKFESLETPMDSKQNLEQRKSWTKQDIEETIEEGTVRRRTEMLAKEMTTEKNIKKSDFSSEIIFSEDDRKRKALSNTRKSTINDVSYLKSAEHKEAFTLGVQTVPRLQALCLSTKSNLLLQTFFLQLTKIMVALSKYLVLEQKVNTVAYSKEMVDEHQNSDDTKREDVNKNKFQERNIDINYIETSSEDNRENCDGLNTDDLQFEGELIKKGKLSGAKIAQIEGNKPAELTDKMDVVISELQRKTVTEEQTDKEQFFRKSSQSSGRKKIDENINKDDVNDQKKDNFFDERDKYFDRRKFFDIIEEKTTSMNVKEMISKKHITEYKLTTTNKQNGNIFYIALVETKHFPYIITEFKKSKDILEHEIKTEKKNDENLVYVAIVETHMHTNKEAIVEEQNRRLAETKAIEESRKKSIDLESNKEVKIIEMKSQNLSIADTPTIEPVSLSLVVQPLSISQIKYAKSATDFEPISKKIAVKNIVQAIEPLLRLESHKFTDKHAQAGFEAPMKALVETTDVRTEEQQTFFKAEVSLTQKSFVSIEKPEPVVEITEITTEEREIVPVEESQPIVTEPQITLEVTGKPIAEISIQNDEANIEIFEAPTIISKKPSIVLEKPILSVAETITATPEYSNEEIIVTKVVTDTAKIDIGTKVAAEISEVSVNEKEQDTIIRAQEISQKLTETLERFALPVAEAITILPAEPKDEKLDTPQIITTKSESIIETPVLIVPDSIAIMPEGPKEQTFEVPIPEFKEPFVNITELTPIVSTIVSPEEPKEESLKIPHVSEALSKILMEHCPLAVALKLAILLAGPMDDILNIPSIITSQAKTLTESPILTVAESFLQPLDGPKEGNLEILKFVQEHAKILIETPNLTVADVLNMIPYGPKDGELDIPQITKDQCKISLCEYISLINSLITSLDHYKDLELPIIDTKLPLVSFESTFLSVASTIAILLLGPDIDNFETAKVTLDNAKVHFEELRAMISSILNLYEPRETNLEPLRTTEKLPHATLENCLMLPEKITIETMDKEDRVKISEPKREKVNTILQKFNAIQETIVLLGEYIHENLKIPQTITRKAQISIQDTILHIANVLTVYSEEPVDENMIVEKTYKQEARVRIEEMKAAEVKFMPLEEPEPDELVMSKIDKKQSQKIMQSSVLTVAQQSAMSPVESVDQSVDIHKAVSKKASINIETVKAAETSITQTEEPKQVSFDVTQIISKKGEKSLVDSKLVAAESLIVHPEEITRANLDVKTAKNQKAQVKIKEHKALETTVIHKEEPKSEEFKPPTIEMKHTEAIIEKHEKSVAQVFMTTTNENESEIAVAAKLNEKHVNVMVESMTPVAQTIVTALEEASNVNQTLKLASSTAKSILVESAVTATAEVSEKDVNILLEKPYVRQPKIEEIEIEANLKLPTIPDDTVTEVSAEYSVELPKEEDVYAEFEFSENKMDIASEIYESIRLMKKQAFQKQCMEASLSLARDLQTKIDMVEIEALEEEFIRSGSISSSSSTATSPLTPILEEYFFSLKMPYLRSRYRKLKDVFEEASLKLKSKIQKTMIQNFDASLTLILQDIAIAQLESEIKDIEVIEIEDYEDVRNLHFSSALLASSQNLSQNSQSFGAIQSSLLSQNHGYSMSVADSALEQSMEASLGRSSHIFAAKSSLSIHGETQNMMMKTSSSKLSTETAESAFQQSASTDRHESNISQADLEVEMEVNNRATQKSTTTKSMQIKQKDSLESSSKETKLQSFQSKKSGKIDSCISVSTEKDKRELGKTDIIEVSDETRTSEASIISDKKLSIKTDVREKEVNEDKKSPSPPIMPPTPLTDEYIFRLQTEMPHPSEYIPRDCSISPESLEEEIILRGGLIPHIKTKIERILYSPPLQTPPNSPDKTVPIYSQGKPGKTGFFKFLS